MSTNTLTDMELTRRVAEALGWRDLEWRYTRYHDDRPQAWYGVRPDGVEDFAPNYATDLNAAAVLLREMNGPDDVFHYALYCWVDRNGQTSWMVNKMDHEPIYSFPNDPEPARAICLARLQWKEAQK